MLHGSQKIIPTFPSMNHELAQAALKNIPNADALVNVVSRRVRQLGQGYRPLVEVHPRWTFMEIALHEVADGKLSYENLSDEEAEKALN